MRVPGSKLGGPLDPSKDAMTFKTKADQDAYYVFLNTNEFAESISYTPYGQSAKTIKALVTRSPVGPDNQSRSLIPKDAILIQISTDDTYGVASVTKGMDSASLPEREGGTAVDWIVSDIKEKTGGMWTLELTR